MPDILEDAHLEAIVVTRLHAVQRDGTDNRLNLPSMLAIMLWKVSCTATVQAGLGITIYHVLQTSQHKSMGTRHEPPEQVNTPATRRLIAHTALPLYRYRSCPHSFQARLGSEYKHVYSNTFHDSSCLSNTVNHCYPRTPTTHVHVHGMSKACSKQILMSPENSSTCPVSLTE